MGIFGGLGKKLKDGSLSDSFARAQAFLNSDYAAVGQINAGAARRKKDQMEAEQEARLIESIRSGLKERGYSDSDINVLMADPKKAAELIKDVLSPWEVGPEGGSRFDPRTKEFLRAPARRQVGRDIIDIDPQGKASTVYSGIEPVVVPQGPQAGVWGWNNKGLVSGPGGAQPPAPAPGELPDELTPEEMEALERSQGGAGPQTPRTFPGGGIFGRRHPGVPF